MVIFKTIVINLICVIFSDTKKDDDKHVLHVFLIVL